jgi:hypothetical protein
MRRAIGVIALALGLVFWASPPQVARATGAYTYPCDIPSAQYDFQTHVVRGAHFGGTGSDYDAVNGDAALRSIHTCTQQQSVVYSAVLPANLQTSNGNYIVQLGYLICHDAGTGCPVAVDGRAHFVYTCSDISMGQPCDAGSWAGTPMGGRRYRFRVEHVSGTWKYSIKDYSTGITKSTTTTAHWSTGDGAWWGGEDIDYGSQLGPKDIDGDVDMYYMMYKRTSLGSDWWITHPNSDTRCALALSDPTSCHNDAWPSYYKASIYNVLYSDGDGLRFWTIAH